MSSKFRKYFTSLNKSEHKCTICLKIVKGTNTTNMKKHLILRHPSKIEKIQENHEQEYMVSHITSDE